MSHLMSLYYSGSESMSVNITVHYYQILCTIVVLMLKINKTYLVTVITTVTLDKYTQETLYGQWRPDTFKTGSVRTPNTEAAGHMMSLFPRQLMVQSDPFWQARKNDHAIAVKKQTNKCLCWLKLHLTDNSSDCEMVVIKQPHNIHFTYKGDTSL